MNKLGRYGIDMIKEIEGVNMTININLVKRYNDTDKIKLEKSLNVIKKYLDEITDELTDKIKSDGYKGINGYEYRAKCSYLKDVWVYVPDTWTINIKLKSLNNDEQFISNMSKIYKESLAKKHKWTGFNVKLSPELQNKIKEEIQLIYN